MSSVESVGDPLKLSARLDRDDEEEKGRSRRLPTLHVVIRNLKSSTNI